MSSSKNTSVRKPTRFKTKSPQAPRQSLRTGRDDNGKREQKPKLQQKHQKAKLVLKAKSKN